jgi:hypothetical protein
MIMINTSEHFVTHATPRLRGSQTRVPNDRVTIEESRLTMPSSNLNGVCRWKRGSILLSIAILLTAVVAVGPVYASVSPGTTVTASSARLSLNFEVNGVADTVTCDEFTDTFVVTSGESIDATIPPPTVAHCTDALAPDQVDSAVTVTTSDKNGSWMLEAAQFGSGGCSDSCVLGLLIPKAGATVASSLMSSCKAIQAPDGGQLLTGKYDPSTGMLKFKNTLVPVGSKGDCSFESPLSLNVTVRFSPNLGRVPPFASSGDRQFTPTDLL